MKLRQEASFPHRELLGHHLSDIPAENQKPIPSYGKVDNIDIAPNALCTK